MFLEQKKQPLYHWATELKLNNYVARIQVLEINLDLTFLCIDFA